MARYKGKEGDLSVGGTSLGERISFDIETSVNTADASTQGNDWTDTDGLQLSATANVEVFWDPGDDQQNLLVPGDTVNCIFYLGGNTTGLVEISGNFLVETRSVAVPVGDLVKTNLTLRNKGAITESTIA